MANRIIFQMDQTTSKNKILLKTIENAFRIQIYTAIITNCLKAIVGRKFKIVQSTWVILQVLGISLLDKTPVKELFYNCRLRRCQRTQS